MYSKDSQLKKNKKPNPKKLSHIELTNFKNYIFSKSGGKCQCGCNRDITEYHHAKSGIHKDDRTLTGIAQHPCHYNIHHGKDMDEKRRLIELFEKIGEENWRGFNG
jgi:hypothetical protein